MTKTVRVKIKQRNKLRRDIKNKKKEWMEACREAAEAIRSAKEESWKEVVEEAVSGDGDERKVWKFIRSLNGTPDTNSPNEVLIHNGRRITSNRKKADLFIGHYADVSKLKFSEEDKAINRRCKDIKKVP